jgi:hypothetical protein
MNFVETEIGCNPLSQYQTELQIQGSPANTFQSFPYKQQVVKNNSMHKKVQNPANNLHAAQRFSTTKHHYQDYSHSFQLIPEDYEDCLYPDYSPMIPEPPKHYINNYRLEPSKQNHIQTPVLIGPRTLRYVNSGTPNYNHSKSPMLRPEAKSVRQGNFRHARDVVGKNPKGGLRRLYAQPFETR